MSEEAKILKGILEDILGRVLPNPPECIGCDPKTCERHNDCHFLLVMGLDYLSLKIRGAKPEEIANHFENSAAIHEAGILVEPLSSKTE